MKNIIVYKALSDSKKEITELLHQTSSNVFFADNLSEFVSVLENYEIGKAYMYVQNLSDIRVLNVIRSFNRSLDTVLIVPPELRNIIELLQDDNLTIIKDIAESTINDSTNKEKHSRTATVKSIDI